MSADAVALVVDPAARQVRLQVGPQAWVLLEELVARAGCDQPGPPAVEVTLASLVDSLRLSAEVIRSALRRLIEAGIIERYQQRAPGTRRFATTRYVIIGRTGLTTLAMPATPVTGRPDTETPDTETPDTEVLDTEVLDMARPRQAQREPRAVGADPQLTLLDSPRAENPTRQATRTTRDRHA